MAKQFVIPKDNDAYPIQAPDGKWLNSKKEATAYKAKLDAKAAVKPTTTKAATVAGSAKRNDDGDVNLTGTFKDSSGRTVSYGFQDQANTTAKPEDVFRRDLALGPQMVTVDGKQVVAIPEHMKSNPGVPNAELKYDAALGAYTVPAGGPNGFMTAHPQTPDFSPQLAFALASGGLLGVTAPAVLAGMGAEGAAAGGATQGVAEGVGGLSGLGGTGYGQAGSLLGDAMQGFTAADAAAGANALGVGAVPGAGAVGGGLGAGTLAGGTAGGGGNLVTQALTGGAPGAGGGLSTLQGITAGGVTPWGAATSGLGVGVAGSAVGTVAQALGDSSQQTTGTTFGIPNNLLGALLPAGLGYLGADSQANAMKDIYNQTRADRMPALNAYNTALQNPNTFYQSAPAMGAVDAVLRKLSVGGNPAANPGSLSQAAAYNLGGYNDYLRGLTPAAFGTANTEANIGMNQAGADAGKYNAVGYGLGQYFNPQPNINDLLKNFSLNIGGVKA